MSHPWRHVSVDHACDAECDINGVIRTGATHHGSASGLQPGFLGLCVISERGITTLCRTPSLPKPKSSNLFDWNTQKHEVHILCRSRRLTKAGYRGPTARRLVPTTYQLHRLLLPPAATSCHPAASRYSHSGCQQRQLRQAGPADGRSVCKEGP